MTEGSQNVPLKHVRIFPEEEAILICELCIFTIFKSLRK